MTKTDDTLQEIWDSHSKGFEKVRIAVDELLWSMIDTALSRGIVNRVAKDTYIDWLRSHMREESFMA